MENKIYLEMKKMDEKIEKLSKRKMKNFKESYNICLDCGDLSTLTKQLEACSSGGMPYCYCRYLQERIFVRYKKISKELWQELNLLKTDKLRLKRYLQHKMNGIKLKSKRSK